MAIVRCELEDSRWWTVEYDKKETYGERRRVLVLKREAFDWADQEILYLAPDSELVRFSAQTVRPDGEVAKDGGEGQDPGDHLPKPARPGARELGSADEGPPSQLHAAVGVRLGRIAKQLDVAPAQRVLVRRDRGFYRKGGKRPGSRCGDRVGGDVREKLDAIHRWVKTNIRSRPSAFGDAGSGKKGKQPTADDVLEQGGGEPDELTLLTMVMLREAGLTVFPLLVNDRASRRLVYDMPDSRQADHLMLEVVVDAQNGFLDPACDYCQPGMPDWRYCGETLSGVRLRPHPSLPLKTTIPAIPAQYNSEVRRETATIGLDGSTFVEGVVSWHGQQDVRWRRRWVRNDM